MANRLSLAASVLVFLSVLLCIGAASAFQLANGYPKRTNTTRSAPPPGLFDLSATNAGINRADCLDDTQHFEFSFVDVPVAATRIEVWARADEKSCAPAAERDTNCFRVARWEIGAAQSVDNLSIVQAMEKKKSVDAKLDAKEVCEKTAHMIPTAVHLHVLAFDASDEPAEIDYVTLYDIGGPPAPLGVTLATGENLLTATFKAPTSNPGDFAKYRAFCFRGAGSTDAGAETGGDAGDAGGDAGSDAGSKAVVSKCPSGHPFVPGSFPTKALEVYACGESTTLAGDIVLDGVQNELPYAVAIAAVDKQGNSGILSEVACDTPRATNSFWDNYTAAGGRAGGGYCAMGHGSATGGLVAISLFSIAAFAARRRRHRALVVAIALFFYASPSLADEERPSIVAFEARFGPYRPRIDRSFSNRSPYEDTFGSTPRLMGGAEVDVTPIHVPSFGSIGFGALFGYTRATAHAAFADGKGVSEEEKTSFDLWLFSALTAVRVDVLAQKTPVPLVPYVKFGVMTSLWSSSDGRGISHGANGLVARGRSNGFLYAAGVMLLLDAFDPQAAKTFEVERGVKHSYVFLELTAADLNGFGQRNAMNVGGVTWTAGIAFQF